MRTYRTLAALTVVLSCRGTASAQIITLHRNGDKTYTCERSGLSSNPRDCGHRPGWYNYVFVGSIAAITIVEQDEKRIQIVPEEIFSGKPPAPLTVLTSQALCLPSMAVGDRWLFFLREEKDKSMVLDYYGSDSRPVADAVDQIATFRRLENIGEYAIVRGEVKQGRMTGFAPVPNARVVARRDTDNLQFVSSTDPDGRFEFPAAPSGHYEITVDPVGSFQPDDSGVEVSGGDCFDLRLYRSPHAQLRGHVTHPDGSPVANVTVIMTTADDSSFSSSETDDRGYFGFDSLEPGEYVVGMNFPYAAGEGMVPPKASVYFGGTTERANALVIKLATDQKRDDLDFVIPNN